MVAAFAFGLQWYSAVIAYPINSGGRPLNSWQVFWLVPFEVGVFAAALCGVIALFWSCGLPRLHHPLFEIPGFERATQDRFFLLATPETERRSGARSSPCAGSRWRGCGDGGPSAMMRTLLSLSAALLLAACNDVSMTQQNRYGTYTPAALFRRWHGSAGLAGRCRGARRSRSRRVRPRSHRRSMRSCWRGASSATISIVRLAMACPATAMA